MFYSYEYLTARMADDRMTARHQRATTPIRARRANTQRRGSFLRLRPGRSEDMGGGR